MSDDRRAGGWAREERRRRTDFDGTFLVAEALTHRLSELEGERLDGATGGGDVLDLLAAARDGPLDDGCRLDALLARIVAQLPPGELPEDLRDADGLEPAGQ